MSLKIMTSIAGWLADYLGMSRRGRSTPIETAEGLRHFLETRASHVAQTSLYGYVRTRAGTRYLELFQEEEFVHALNIAKWQIWLACLADLAVFAGTLIFRHGTLTAEQVTHLMRTAADGALAAVGTPADAGPAFADGVRHVQIRLDQTDWSSITDDEQAFCESPGALVEWAPVVDELKQYDTEIVKNSIRFRWHEIRRNLRHDLDIEAVIAPLLGHSGLPPLASGGDRADQIH